jgi:hypothetical protein
MPLFLQIDSILYINYEQTTICLIDCQLKGRRKPGNNNNITERSEAFIDAADNKEYRRMGNDL